MKAGGVHRSVADRVSVRTVFRNRTFSVLYLAEAQSIIGDQLARVALSVLVFERTGSTPATAGTYAATFLPALFGGFFLGRVGDVVPRRTVLVGCDLLRAACFAVMMFGGVSLGVVIALVVVAVALGPVFSAAQLSLLATRVRPDEFTTANAMRLVTSQVAQVGGFALGGLLVVLVEPRGALGINAITFALSALIVRLLVPAHDPPAPAPAHDRDEAGDGAGATVSSRDRPGAGDTFGGLWGDRQIRPLVVLSLLIGFFVVPEGLAVPFGASISATTGQVGLLLAAGALGGALGAAFMVRVRPTQRTRASCVMSVGCGLPLVVSGLLDTMTTAWWIPAACWLISGVFAAYVVHTTTLVVQAIPDHRRARLVGIMSALTLATQGLGVVLFGVIGELTSPSAAIALAGGIGSTCALVTILGAFGHATERAWPQPSERRHGGDVTARSRGSRVPADSRPADPEQTTDLPR